MHKQTYEHNNDHLNAAVKIYKMFTILYIHSKRVPKSSGIYNRLLLAFENSPLHSIVSEVSSSLHDQCWHRQFLVQWNAIFSILLQHPRRQ